MVDQETKPQSSIQPVSRPFSEHVSNCTTCAAVVDSIGPLEDLCEMGRQISDPMRQQKVTQAIISTLKQKVKMSTCCTCDTSWPWGTDGSHSCTDALRKKIESLEVKLAAKDEQPPEMSTYKCPLCRHPGFTNAAFLEDHVLDEHNVLNFEYNPQPDLNAKVDSLIEMVRRIAPSA